MKKLLVLLLLCFSLQGASINLTISGIKSIKGSMRIVLFNNAQNFDDEQSEVAWKIEKVTDTVMVVQFDSLKTGTYGIKVFQDLNENEELDMSLFGPKEPYGFSNNIRHKLRGATFTEAAFDVNGNETLEITIE